MDIEEVRGKTQDQLSDELAKLKKEQFNLRFQRATGQLENVARVRDVRRTIARIKTVMKQNDKPPASSAGGHSKPAASSAGGRKKPPASSAGGRKKSGAR